MCTEQLKSAAPKVGMNHKTLAISLGAVKANDVIRVLVRGGSLSGLGHAISDIGWIAKTMYMLRYVSDET